MSNVIQFLEAMGRNPGIHGLSAADYAASVALLEIDGAQRQALLDRDSATLSDLVDGRARMMCFISVPSPDDHEAIPDDDKDGDGVPDEDEPPYEQ